MKNFIIWGTILVTSTVFYLGGQKIVEDCNETLEDPFANTREAVLTKSAIPEIQLEKGKDSFKSVVCGISSVNSMEVK